MAEYNYKTTSASDEYYSRFIASDRQRFLLNKDYIDFTLKPLSEQKGLMQNAQGRLLDVAKKDYRSIFLQKDDMKKELNLLDEKRRVAEEQAKRKALKQGLSLTEAQYRAKEVGKEYKRQEGLINFFKKPVIDEKFESSSKNVASNLEKYNTLHNSYEAADMALSNALFSQSQLALNISSNTNYWATLKAFEMKSEALK